MNIRDYSLFMNGEGFITIIVMIVVGRSKILKVPILTKKNKIDFVSTFKAGQSRRTWESE